MGINVFIKKMDTGLGEGGDCSITGLYAGLYFLLQTLDYLRAVK